MIHDDEFYSIQSNELSAPVKYSKQRYARLSHGIHTWGEDDDRVFWLVRHGYGNLIEWTK